MALERHELEGWIKASFKTINLSDLEIKISELSESISTDQYSFVLYELGKTNAEAGFVFWLRLCQKASVKAFHSFFPLAYTSSIGTEVNYVPAFRNLKWIKTTDTRNLDANFYIPLIAAYVAGVKQQAYIKAKAFSESRYQGGKFISDWSLIKNMLNELHLEVHRESILVSTIDLAVGLSILQTMDQFVSKCMQTFGGAGYIEDYEVENLFRICHFLKSWPRPFKDLMMNLDTTKGSIYES